MTPTSGARPAAAATPYAGAGAPPSASATPAAGAGARPVAPARASTAPVGPGAPPPKAAGGLPEPLRNLYTAYNQARQQVGQSEPISVDVFTAALQKQYAAIKAQFKCNHVEFKVAIKDGRAILKAEPK